MPQYPKEQIWKIYEKLPDELKDAIFSEETAENISNICEKNGIEDGEKISQVARLTGNVLMGLLLPNEFQQNLEKETGLEKETAKKIVFGIQRFVFFPVKQSLSALYQMEIVSTPEPIEQPKLKKKSTKKDTYRELIE